jgi:hypothetical protein
MQALKIIVVGLGLLILIGITVVIVTVSKRLSGSGAGFASAALQLPKGCRVLDMATAGGRLALRLGDGPDCQAILFVDPATGQQTGRLDLQQQP